MARLRVIVLNQLNSANSYNCLFWADVPAARQGFYADASAASAWKDALPADNQALQNGSVVERGSVQTFQAGTTLGQIEAYLQGEWQKFQDSITSSNPWIHYGSTWDGVTWNVVTGT